MQSNTPAVEFVMLQSRLNSRLTKQVEQRLSAHGISFAEYMILNFLSEAAKKTMRRIELAQSVGLSASGVTRILAPMEKIGLVEKEAIPRDARVSLVKLTKAGERIFKEASISLEQSADSFTGSLNNKKLYALIATMKELIQG